MQKVTDRELIRDQIMLCRELSTSDMPGLRPEVIDRIRATALLDPETETAAHVEAVRDAVNICSITCDSCNSRNSEGVEFDGPDDLPITLCEKCLRDGLQIIHDATMRYEIGEDVENGELLLLDREKHLIIARSSKTCFEELRELVRAANSATEAVTEYTQRMMKALLSENFRQ